MLLLPRATVLGFPRWRVPRSTQRSDAAWSVAEKSRAHVAIEGFGGLALDLEHSGGGDETRAFCLFVFLRPRRSRGPSAAPRHPKETDPSAYPPLPCALFPLLRCPSGS